MTICSLTLDQVTGSGHTLPPPLETRRLRTPHLPPLDLPRPPQLPAQGSSRVQLRWRTRTPRGVPRTAALWTSGGPTSSPPPHRRCSCWSYRWVGGGAAGVHVHDSRSRCTHMSHMCVWCSSSVCAFTKRVLSPTWRCPLHLVGVYSFVCTSPTH